MKVVKGIPTVQEMDRNVVKYPSDSRISDYGAVRSLTWVVLSQLQRLDKRVN